MFHIHWHNQEVYNDQVDALYECRCGDVVHKELIHRYNERRTPQQTQTKAEQLITRYKRDREQTTYRIRPPKS